MQETHRKPPGVNQAFLLQEDKEMNEGNLI